jgi:DNA-binding MarR family transcriptional regulator
MQDRPEIAEAITSLQRLCEVFVLRRRQLAAEAGLTEAQWRLLEEIAEEDFMPSLFARRRDCTAAAVSRGLRSLLDRALITSAIAPGDGRQRVYRLTRAGRNALGKLRRGRERAIAAVWEDLDAKALRRFSAFADELAGHLERYATAAPTKPTSPGAPTSRGSAARVSR